MLVHPAIKLFGQKALAGEVFHSDHKYGVKYMYTSKGMYMALTDEPFSTPVFKYNSFEFTLNAVERCYMFFILAMVDGRIEKAKRKRVKEQQRTGRQIIAEAVSDGS